MLSGLYQSDPVSDMAGGPRADRVGGTSWDQGPGPSGGAYAAGLIQRSALLRQAQAGGRLRIEAAVFDIASGRVQLL